MIGANLYRRLLEERARRLEAERRLSELLAAIETRVCIAQRIATKEIVQTRRRRTAYWHRASAERAALSAILQEHGS